MITFRNFIRSQNRTKRFLMHNTALNSTCVIANGYAHLFGALKIAYLNEVVIHYFYENSTTYSGNKMTYTSVS